MKKITKILFAAVFVLLLSVCINSKAEAVNEKEHTYKTTVTKATLTTDGKITKVCSICGEKKTQTIAKIKSVTLSSTAYTYNGKNKTPTVTVKDTKGKKLVADKDYKVGIASKRSAVGKYTVKVTFKGNYSGTKSVYFYIKTGNPSSVKAVSQTTSAIKLSWSAVSGATGYTVYRYSPSKKAYVKVASTAKRTLTVSKLNVGTKYTFKVVSYAKGKDGKIYQSENYSTLKTATKTKTPSLTKVIEANGNARLYWSAVSGETGYTVYYSAKKDSGFKKYANFKANSTNGYVKNLTSGKTYYFKVRCYISTDSGTVYSAWSGVKKLTMAKKNNYSAVLTEYRYAIAGKSNYNYQYMDPSWLQVFSYSNPVYYYALYDINSDGTDELVIMVKTQHTEQIINIFTYKNMPVPLLGKKAPYGERARLTIYTNGIIEIRGSGGAFNCCYEYRKLPAKSDSLKTIERYDCDTWNGFKCTKTDENGKKTSVSESYYRQRINYYSGLNKIKPSWKKIAA